MGAGRKDGRPWTDQEIREGRSSYMDALLRDVQQPQAWDDWTSASPPGQAAAGAVAREPQATPDDPAATAGQPDAVPASAAPTWSPAASAALLARAAADRHRRRVRQAMAVLAAVLLVVLALVVRGGLG